MDEIDAWPMPDPDDFDYARVPDQCARFDEFALAAGGDGTVDIINQTGMLRTMEQTLVDLATDDPAGLRLIDKRVDIQYEITRRTLAAAGGRIDILRIGEDLGTQIGPLVSPKIYREQIRPRHQKFVDLARSYGLPVMIHSCGSSSWAFEAMIEMGIGVVDTLQPEAAQMAPAYLKERFGGRLAFHGCISTAGPVAYGTAAETAADVRQTLEIMMPGGGYLLSPTHALQDNSPTENVLALYEAARNCGTY